MAAANPLGPQPDFQLIANEILKIANTPAIAGGQEILNEMRAIREQSARMEIALQESIANVRREVGNVQRDVGNVRRDLMTMMRVSNHNNAARVQNAHMENRTPNLSPFLNPVTGEGIPYFPLTVDELEGLNRRRLRGLLQQLDIQYRPRENQEALMRMLRAHIGLRATRTPSPHERKR